MKIKGLYVYHAPASMRETALCSMMLVLYTLSLSVSLCAQEQPPESPLTKGEYMGDGTHPQKVMIAVRADIPPEIDGVLDDEVWQHAPIATGFTQKDPDEGKPATEKTTVQIAYDDEAVYAGIFAYDSEPEKIIARLYRRDGLHEGESDWVGVYFDPHHDHQTGNFFLVGPSGVLKDGIIYNDSEFDETWDGVWESETAVHDKGWTVEYKIPYNVLRFSQKGEYTWGMNVARHIARKHEYDFWVTVSKKESGLASLFGRLERKSCLVSRFGHLERIEGIHPSKHMKFLPFALGRSTFEPESPVNPHGRELLSSAGLDFRYGLSTNLSINVTINPDFGQVEADPAVLNLSVFETFFEERRPFFVEGASIFKSENLFYSRRIGKPPGYFDVSPGTRTIHQPDATTILGAAKLTGKTADKTSIGILEAVTAPEYATIEEVDRTDGAERVKRSKHLIEPLTNYFVGRVQQDLLKGNSRVGFLATAVNREDAEDAYVGAMDWNLKFGKNAHQFTSTIGMSRVGASEDWESGYLAHLTYDKTSGWFRGGTWLSVYSPGFNPNDLGFIEQVNRLFPGFWMEFRREQSWGPFHRLSLDMNGGIGWNFRHEWAGQTERWVNLSRGMEFGFHPQFRNFWSGAVGVYHRFEGLDDMDTRGGPLIIIPAATHAEGWIEGDSRRSIIPEFSFLLGADAEGSIHRGFGVGLRIKPASNIELHIGPGYNRRFDKAQWVKNVDDNGDGIHDHFVYGELKSRTLDLTMRVNVTFTPDLSLQFYMQPFIAAGDYSNFKELARPASYEFTPYTDLDEDPDFSYRSLRSNLVFRWEYRPGSTLFLVWSQSRTASSDDPSFRPWDSVMESFSDEGQNIFLIKLNYWLGL